MSLIEGAASEDAGAANEPLAARMRPRDLTEFFGQEHLVGEGKILRQMIERDQIPSMILWGPPGVGKTTLANVVANLTKAEFVNYSAVTSGIKEIKEIMARAESGRRVGMRTVLFVDEIHRFNKAQQDAFLTYVEKGSIILIGATTENPSFDPRCSPAARSSSSTASARRRSSNCCAARSRTSAATAGSRSSCRSPFFAGSRSTPTATRATRWARSRPPSPTPSSTPRGARP